MPAPAFLLSNSASHHNSHHAAPYPREHHIRQSKELLSGYNASGADGTASEDYPQVPHPA